MTNLVWQNTISQHWSVACRSWETNIEIPLKNWCGSNNVGCATNWHGPVTRVIGASNKKKYIFFYTIEFLSPEIINDLQKTLHASNACAVIFTNTKVISDHHWANLEIVFMPELYGAFYLESHDHEHRDERLFSCLMRRADTVRQSWFYALHKLGLLDQGFVSYLSINPQWNDPNDHVTGFDHIHHSWNMGDNEHYQRAWTELRSKLPYQNFDEDSLSSCHDRCKYSIVLSTHNDNDNGHWFNEKEARALQSASIVIPSLLPATIRFLTDIGLRLTFDQSSYHDYPWWHRQDKILEILATDGLQIDWHLRISTRDHNRMLFKQWNDAIRSHDLLETMIRIASQKLI